MGEKSGLTKILDSLKAKIILPVAGLILLSGCYTYVGISSPPPKKPVYFYLQDSDGDGIPDIYDPRPYFYDFHVFAHPYYSPYYPPHHWHPYYPPKVKIETKKHPPIKERKENIQRLRDNSGGRNSGQKR